MQEQTAWAVHQECKSLKKHNFYFHFDSPFLINAIFAKKNSNMRQIFSIFILIFITQIAFAQGTIKVTEEPEVSNLMNRYLAINESTSTVEGWRIQLLATSDRSKVEDAKRRFQTLYPNIYVDWTHSKPYYKLRAGAYGSKLEATRMLYVMKKDYPTAYPAKDDTIRPIDLLNQG